jgi:hypothetical protein
MANHMDNGLGSVIKSLRDVVVPSVNPADPIAREQLGLAIDFLEFLRARMELAIPQLEYELAQNVQLAQSVLAIVDADLGQDLAHAVSAAQGGDRVTRSAEDLRRASQAIAEAVDALVRKLSKAKPELRTRVEAAVIEGSAALLAFERSWYEPLAVDVDVGTLPHFSTYLRLPAQQGGKHP